MKATKTPLIQNQNDAINAAKAYVKSINTSLELVSLNTDGTITVKDSIGNQFEVTSPIPNTIITNFK